MLEDYISRYDTFVRANPRLSAEIEAIIRWSSYLVATRKSPVFGELLSSGANLLQLCNDIILRQANSELKLSLGNCATQLKTFLSVIQSLELLAEIYARETYGTTGKWAIITVIQITKAAIKLLLLLVFDDGLTKTQSIVPLDRLQYAEVLKLQERFNLQQQNEETENPESNEPLKNEDEPGQSKSVVLKSSGRRMRSITESPPKGARFVQESKNSTDTQSPFSHLQRKRLTMLLNRYKEHKSAALTERQLYGELLHISRPIAHLALMGSFGTKSWISYLTALAMDLSSLYLVRSPLPLRQQTSSSSSLNMIGPQIPENYQFNINERMELGQRASSLLLYLLRSPFFDEYTKQRALEGIATTAENIPLFGSFLATFVNYIPDWQKDYFRVWSD
uniref:Peroxisomal membrane protein PEX16 n=1 Tax=Aceria tosichella TaxID=561515 RepID=A0A6G1SA14_9ACAR